MKTVFRIAGIRPSLGRARSAIEELPGYTIPLGLLITALFAHWVSEYYFLGDDSFISFRYARNLVEGHGLVYNPGERVEGYTNFLWVVMLAGLMKLGIAPEPVSNVLGIASGALILVVVLCFGAKTRGWGDPFIWIAPLCLAANRTFCAWSTGGLATQFFSLLVLLGMLQFVAERRRSATWPWLSSLLLALATLTRPEGALFFGVAACFFIGEAVVLRRRQIRGMVPWIGLYVLIVGIHVAWRYGYYGYPLPNTFYAKVSGFWWAQSKVWLGTFAWHYSVIWLWPLLLVAVVLKRNFVVVLFAVLLGLYTAYLVYVGGDHHEFRLLTPVLPFLYWLFQEGIAATHERWHAKVAKVGIPVPLGVLAGIVMVIATALSNNKRFSYEWQVATGIASVKSTRVYAAGRIDEGKFLRGLVEDGLLKGDELLAVVGAGALPYYSRLPALDPFGLNDVTVAHREITKRGIIAHEKRAPHAYLVRRGVVIYEALKGIVQRPVMRGRGTPELPRTVTTPFYEGPMRCVKAKGRYLLFATTLSDEAFRKIFARFEIVF